MAFVSYLSEQDDVSGPEVMIMDLEHIEAHDSPFFGDEEVGIISVSSITDEVKLLPVEKVLFEYVEVIDGCGPHFEGECLRVQ